MHGIKNRCTWQPLANVIRAGVAPYTAAAGQMLSIHHVVWPERAQIEREWERESEEGKLCALSLSLYAKLQFKL